MTTTEQELRAALWAIIREFERHYDGPEHPLNVLAEQIAQARAVIGDTGERIYISTDLPPD